MRDGGRNRRRHGVLLEHFGDAALLARHADVDEAAHVGVGGVVERDVDGALPVERVIAARLEDGPGRQREEQDRRGEGEAVSRVDVAEAEQRGD